jgi:TolB protein
MKTNSAFSTHSLQRLCWTALIAIMGFIFHTSSRAQFRVEISGVGVTQLPIAIATFKGEDAAPQKIGSIVLEDLVRSGQFKSIDAAGAALDETSRPDMSPWKQKGADHLLVGSIAKLADGRYDVRFRLWDAVRGQDVASASFPYPAGDLRLSAHKIADMKKAYFLPASPTSPKPVAATACGWPMPTDRARKMRWPALSR